MLKLVETGPSLEERARFETRALLALSTIPGWGYWTIKNAVAAGLSLHELLHLSSADVVRSTLKDAGVKNRFTSVEPWPSVATNAWKAGAALHQRLAANGTQVILRGSSAYPKALEDLRDPPEWLFVRGNVDVLTQRSLALVGTRTPSEEGLHLCWYLGEFLRLFGAPTISGLAMGIDQEIHKASLRVGIPTVAVLGNGIFVEFPSGSAALADEIVRRGGAIVTEYLPEQGYAKENFVRRNRIQAGLACALIPVEWKFPSGTAHTIGFAQELGRPLIAIHARTADVDARPDLLEVRRRGGKLFAIPGEEESLLTAIRHVLTADPVAAAPTPGPPAGTQLKLI